MSIAFLQFFLCNRTREVPPWKHVGFCVASCDSWWRICENDVEPDPEECRYLFGDGTVRRPEVLVAIFLRGGRMEHSGLAHPEFGFLSPTPRLRRELRIAATALLFGGIAGALCVSGVIALRPSDRAATEVAEAPRPAEPQESEFGTARSADARATTSESHAGITAPPASGEAPAQESRESSATSAQVAAPASAIMPKTRVVRIRKTVDSHALARLPLGRTETPAAATPPTDPLASSPDSSAANDAPATAPEKSASEKAVAGSSARAALANSSPPKKKVQKTVRTARSRGNEIENDSFSPNERPDWSARYAAPASADVPVAPPEKAITRTGAREGLADSSSPKKALKTVRNASSRRDDMANDSLWRDERQDDWSARAAAANDPRNPVSRASAREDSLSVKGFWDWSR
jgi:hypothetical protein